MALTNFSIKTSMSSHVGNGGISGRSSPLGASTPGQSEGAGEGLRDGVCDRVGQGPSVMEPMGPNMLSEKID